MRGPASSGARQWRDAFTDAVEEFRDDNATDWAASLTYYGVLSIFPGVIVLFALLGLFGSYPETSNAMLEILDELGPESAVDTLTDPIKDITKESGKAGAFLGLGTIAAIWAASGYLGAFSRASNAIFGVEEDRPFWKLRPQQVLVTVILLVLSALLMIGIVVSGPIAEAIGDVVGLGDTTLEVWSKAKWPVMILLVAVMLAILFYWAPDLEGKRFSWIAPGSLFAVLAVILASALFGLYLSHFDSYGATYGSLGGVIVFLLWLWIANNGLLLGQELNAQLDRRRIPEGEGKYDRAPRAAGHLLGLNYPPPPHVREGPDRQSR